MRFDLRAAISYPTEEYASAAQVEKVKAVAQIEANMAGKTFRIGALVPVESKDIVKDLKRVTGVGVTAIVDVRL